MSQHTITAEHQVSFTFPGLAEDERETAYPTLAITYRFSPYRPAHTPRGEYAPIDPPEPAEVELISATLINGDGLDPTDQQVQEWAQNWLDGNGYDLACDQAERDNVPDPDEAYERMRDDARDFDGL